MSKEQEAKEMYEALGKLFLERGEELGLGRALTAEEAASDPVLSPYIESLIDKMLGIEVASS